MSTGEDNLIKTDRQKWAEKAKPTQWSKKEILGHLIDSTTYNLKWFTEIYVKPKIYQIVDYKQNDLVLINAYQSAETKDLIMLWVGLNRQIINVIKEQTEKTLQINARLPKQKITNLIFLINDYLEHLEHM